MVDNGTMPDEEDKKSARRAESILRKLFGNSEGNAISREAILRQITKKTFHNYNPMLIKHGLVKPVFNKDGRTIAVLRLTDKGAQVLNRNSQIPIQVVTAAPERPTAAPVPDLDE